MGKIKKNEMKDGMVEVEGQIKTPEEFSSYLLPLCPWHLRTAQRYA